MRLLFPIVMILLTTLLWHTLTENRPLKNKEVNEEREEARVKEATRVKMKQQLKKAIPYIRERNFRPNLCLLADLSAPSGSDRLFLYDPEKDSLLASGPVAHGRCNERWLEGMRYSNTNGSGCSSPGRYRIGAKYTGRFGHAYKLHGLDSSNSNAYERFIVLHAHECVPAKSVFPDEICQSDGCPTVSPTLFKAIEKQVDRSGKPVLLWLYE